GPMPAAVQSLLAVARIKALGRKAGVGSIASERDAAAVKMLSGLSFPPAAGEVLGQYRGRVIVAPRGAGLRVRSRGLSERDFLGLLESIMQDLLDLTRKAS